MAVIEPADSELMANGDFNVLLIVKDHFAAMFILVWIRRWVVADVFGLAIFILNPTTVRKGQGSQSQSANGKDRQHFHIAPPVRRNLNGRVVIVKLAESRALIIGE